MPDNDTDQSKPEGGGDDMTAALLEEPTGLDDSRVTDPTVYAGALGDDPDTEISVAADVEATLLTALMWTDQHSARRILAAVEARHFYRPVHATIAAAIAEVAAAGNDPTPILVRARLSETGALRGGSGQLVMSALVTLTAPLDRPITTTAGMLPLAVHLLDAWYRRGYTGLLRRMEQHRLEASVEELGDCWAQLTRFQQRAEADWMARRQTLTRDRAEED
ncbi:DnaB-like helicase N terminal domain-containing protein [Williamsia serinedens]|uniref:DnaB-like helicase N terminal domain-containing protein n=2 Tax=Williamsia serinedens TaxID=391736 RepID=A0ABT1H7F4_9NOCA|nr:DnaB-like helicase N terminal domain-containing protein [Williamsia serinedens]